MEDATIKKQGKGWVLSFSNGKSMTINWQNLPNELDGKPVKVERVSGQPQKIVWEDKTFERATVQAGPAQAKHNAPAANGNNGLMARAPYNFVPLPNQIKIFNGASTAFDSYDTNKHSGYIDITVEAVSDIFIRGALEKFFTVNGKMAIPGSSLRGMVRNLVEIMSASSMHFVDAKRRFFYRNISDAHYRDQVIQRSGNVIKYCSSAGWLSFANGKYYLVDAGGFFKIDRNKLRQWNIPENNAYSVSDIWYNPRNITRYKQKNNLQLECNILNDVRLQPAAGYKKGALVITGLFDSNKHYQWVVPEPTTGNNKVDVTEIMSIYEKDSTRDESANLLTAVHRGRTVPCFYLTDAHGKPKYIGHTGVFRIPYDHELKAFVPNTVQNDLATTLFGLVDTDAGTQKPGKVFFEDAFATSSINNEFAALKILSSPKPTCYQHYLEPQPSGAPTHWGQKGKIRGFKMYWHRLAANWHHNDVTVTAATKQELIQKCLVDKETQYTVGEVVKKEATFQGRIRFENLSDVELGALVAALDLPQECAHKIGMGKPLGLGSIRIKPSLTLIKRPQRYNQLFAEATSSSFFTAAADEKDLSGWKNKLAQYLQPGSTDWGKFLETDSRLKELYTMLLLKPIADKNAWVEATRYMEIEYGKDEARGIKGRNEYTNRPVLPRPTVVKNNPLD
ncbi:MAG TPA: TIGR03986 family CRISPR-associated RAMP protein [Phnomibacter sp.]|nr:TIGR03986 family CRISPR-associated RAMP protein [Phnomibacter sp.]